MKTLKTEVRYNLKEGKLAMESTKRQENKQIMKETQKKWLARCSGSYL
jgi:hypothetical protein